MSEGTPKSSLSRRQLLQAAGGITFSALIPLDNGLFKAVFGENGNAIAPQFTAMPYLQPGTTSSLLTHAGDTMTVAWQTDGAPARFELTYGESNFNSHAKIESVERQPAEYKGGLKVNYSANLENLHLNKKYQYRVTMDGQPLIEGYFTTRKPRGTKTRFVTFGDNSCGSLNDHAIAYYAYQAKPDFVMNLGDNVYNNGLDSEYTRYFFPVYNSDVADPKIGAPLLRSVPFYSVLANHDLTGNDPKDHQVANFTRHPDSLGYFTNLHLPLNGPKPNHPMQAFGDQVAIDKFTAAAGSRYPTMGNYSFDYGDVHFTCIDSNIYVDPTDQDLQDWIAKDLTHTDAAWKIVVFHHPSFNVGREHYREQHMRALSPLFEQHGVHVVLSGHEHTYQRTRPMKFAPTNLDGAKNINNGHRLVPGKFTIDEKYDGVQVTKPEGILYLTSGAGGNDLYDPDMNRAPSTWTHEEDEHAAYVALMVTDRHSLTVVDADRHELQFSQIDENGQEIDRFKITKK